MESEPDDDAPIELNENDRDAARKAMVLNWPALEPASPEYLVKSEALAGFHNRIGPDRFQLYYNLRPPRDRTEEWTKQFMQGQITDSELRDRYKADAERPIDVEMLTGFHNAYQENLTHYSGILQSAVLMPRNKGTSAWRSKEIAIDEHVAALRGKLPLWRENMETVFEFLEELRISSGAGLVKLGDYEGTSAHWLAQQLFSRVSEAWMSCRDVSDRSHRDSRYTYAARAIDLFSEKWRASFPSPQGLHERLREEFVLARIAIKRASAASPASSTTAASTLVAVDMQRMIDNESRELILVGEMTTLVAKAGHIFRPTPYSDWGIDGEIEFKDGAGHASGRRLYVQLKRVIRISCGVAMTERKYSR